MTAKCFSNNPELGDSAYWAITAIDFLIKKDMKRQLAVVDNCFDIWGLKTLYISKRN